VRYNRAHVIAVGAFLWAAATFLVAVSGTFAQVRPSSLTTVLDSSGTLGFGSNSRALSLLITESWIQFGEMGAWIFSTFAHPHKIQCVHFRCAFTLY
jgi:hypothetical protein